MALVFYKKLIIFEHTHVFQNLQQLPIKMASTCVKEFMDFMRSRCQKIEHLSDLIKNSCKEKEPNLTENCQLRIAYIDLIIIIRIFVTIQKEKCWNQIIDQYRVNPSDHFKKHWPEFDALRLRINANEKYYEEFFANEGIHYSIVPTDLKIIITEFLTFLKIQKDRIKKFIELICENINEQNPKTRIDLLNIYCHHIESIRNLVYQEKRNFYSNTAFSDFTYADHLEIENLIREIKNFKIRKSDGIYCGWSI